MTGKFNIKLIVSNLIMFIGIVIFVSLFSTFFGKENTLIGVALITAILMFKVVDLSLACKDAVITIIFSFVYMAISVFLSSMNSYLGIIINFISIFIMMYLFTNRVETKAYLPFILGYIFMEGNHINTFHQLGLRILGSLIGSIILAVVYYKTHKDLGKHKDKTIASLLKNLDFGSLQFNFALRMAIGVSLAMFIGSLFNFQKSMWISMTVMSLTQPHYEQSKERMKQRIIGTLIGASTFIVLFKFVVPAKLSYIALLFLGYVYTFIKTYNIQIIFITINALGAAMILYNPFVSAPMRIGLVLLGAVIAILINKVVYDDLRFNSCSSCKVSIKHS